MRDMPPIPHSDGFTFAERDEIVTEKRDLDARLPQSVVDELDAQFKADLDAETTRIMSEADRALNAAFERLVRADLVTRREYLTRVRQ
jgi:hypothetical protein